MLKKTFTIAGFDLFPEVYTGVFLVLYRRESSSHGQAEALQEEYPLGEWSLPGQVVAHKIAAFLRKRYPACRAFHTQDNLSWEDLAHEDELGRSQEKIYVTSKEIGLHDGRELWQEGFLESHTSNCLSLEGLNSHDLRYANQFRSPANKCYFEIDEFLEVK